MQPPGSQGGAEMKKLVWGAVFLHQGGGGLKQRTGPISRGLE